MSKLLFLIMLVCSLSLVIGAADEKYVVMNGGSIYMNSSDICINNTGVCLSNAASGGNASWTQALADTLYAPFGSGNASWNESYADTQYADISVTGDNESWNESWADTQYADISVTGDNESWNESWADTQYADISVTGGNASWNETLANTLYLLQSEEGNLNVNSSDYWDNYNTANTTWFENIAGALSLKLTELSSYLDTWLGTKTSDDLAEGSTNLYDNESWNESWADTQYADISVTGGNASWNESWADTQYADISVTGDNESWNESLANTLYADISVTGDNESWNESWADTQYADISVTGDNESWNESLANTLYADISVTGDNESWNESLANTLYADISVTGDNESWNESWADTQYADISVTGDNESWNESLANTLYADISVTGDNESWNESWADTQYADISVTGDNESWNETWADTQYADISVTGDNESWNESWADTQYADISVTGGNASWNETLANTLYILQSEEGNLNVNSSDYWDEYNTANTTWFENIAGALSLKLTELSSYLDTWLGTKTSDDLAEGSTNLYDNESWNESWADTQYADISVTGGNSTWNETLANELYVNINGDNMTGNLNNTGNITANDFIIPEMTGNDGTFSVNDFFTQMTSAGRLTGGDIVASTGTSVIVTEGTGLLRDLDDDVSQVRSYMWDNSSAINVPTDSIMYFGIDLNSGTPIVVNYSSDDNFDLDTSFPLGTVINQGDVLYIMNNPWWVGDGLTNIIERFQAEGWLERDDNRGGLILGYTGTRNPTMTAGTLWSRLTEHEFSDFTAPGDTFSYFYRDGAGGYTEIKDQTQWNVSHYDDGDGGLEPITNGDFAVIWVWANVASGNIALIYPQQTYDKSAQAEAETIPTTFPAIWYKGGVIIGRIIIEEGVDEPTSVQSAFTTTFTAGLAADHGNLAGLSDDDHTQYLLVNGTRNATEMKVTNNITAQYFIGNGSKLTGIESGNSTWNEVLANGLYAPINYGDDWNKTYADTLYAAYGSGNASWNETLANSLYRLQSWDNITGVPHATPSDGDTTHFSLADEIYDWIISLSYATTTYVDNLMATYTSNLNFTNDANYWNDTYATFNKTYADTLYADISVTGDNESWNESWADTQYADISVTGDNESWNESWADTQYADISVTGDNESWNESWADTQYADISVTGDNESWNESWADTQYADISVTGDNESWNESLANTLYADISVTGGNASWNETLANTLYILQSEEGNLNVNSSDYWDNYNTANTTWFENIAGALSLKLTELSSYLDTWLGTKTSDDLAEGSTNLYDNESWNESWADTQYADISVTGGNASWNESWADTQYADISVTGDNESWNESWADTQYADISVTGDNESWNETWADTQYADISVTGDNESWNETWADTKYIQNDSSATLTKLNVSDHFKINTVNITCFNAGCTWYSNATDDCLYWSSGGKTCGAA